MRCSVSLGMCLFAVWPSLCENSETSVRACELSPCFCFASVLSHSGGGKKLEALKERVAAVSWGLRSPSPWLWESSQTAQWERVYYGKTWWPWLWCVYSWVLVWDLLIINWWLLLANCSWFNVALFRRPEWLCVTWQLFLGVGWASCVTLKHVPLLVGLISFLSLIFTSLKLWNILCFRTGVSVLGTHLIKCRLNKFITPV